MAGPRTLGRLLASELAQRGMKQSDLVRETGLNKNTVSSLLNDRVERPSPHTLGSIERAMGLTPGTLVGFGEDMDAVRERPLDRISSQRLATTLAQRVADMDEALSEWERPAARYERRAAETFAFAMEHRDAGGRLGRLARRLVEFDSLETDRPLTSAEEAELDDVTLALDALRWNGEQVRVDDEAESV